MRRKLHMCTCADACVHVQVIGHMQRLSHDDHEQRDCTCACAINHVAIGVKKVPAIEAEPIQMCQKPSTYVRVVEPVEGLVEWACACFDSRNVDHSCAPHARG